MILIKISLIGGLLAGTLAILYMSVFAYAVKNIPPKQVFQFIASGLYGIRSYKGGIRSAVIGCLLHYMITITMTFAFAVLAQQFPDILLRYPMASGFAYGLVLFFFMHYVLLPKSEAVPKPKLKGITIGHELVSHTLFAGIPIAFTTALILL